MPQSSEAVTYDEAQSYVSSLPPRGWRLGLERMAEFARRANLNHPNSKFIHVAGTNGKGSVTAYLQSIFVEMGLRTGGFFSPYVYDPRERIQFGRELISKEDFARLVTHLKPIAESMSASSVSDMGGITEFEMKTAVGFAYWQERQCDWVALEVGLGGLYDSTNIITPETSVIASIGLDHIAILGDTLAMIAHEKAGVIKRGRPVIVGELPKEAAEVIEREAAERSAPIWRFGREVTLTRADDGYTISTPARRVTGLHPGLVGVKQPENMSLAVAAILAAGLTPSDEQLRVSVEKAYVPGRFEVRRVQGQTLVLDGAHNGEAAEVLAKSLAERYPNQKFALVTGMVAGHDPARFYRPLIHAVGPVFVTPIDFHRALAPADLSATLHSIFEEVTTCSSATNAVELALKTGLPVLVTGSFYLVGDVGSRLTSD